jgi:hypothetical protein
MDSMMYYYVTELVIYTTVIFAIWDLGFTGTKIFRVLYYLQNVK